MQVRNKDTAMCLDTFGRKAGEKVGMADCHALGGNQVCCLSLGAAVSFTEKCHSVVLIILV